MSGERIKTRNPYPNVRVSEKERQHLIDLVSGFIEDHFKKYEEFVVVDKRQVDEQHWEHVKSKDNLHVYTERIHKNHRRKSKSGEDDVEKDLAVMLSVGTLVGELDDLMFGLVTPTHEAMAIRTSYIGEVDNGAMLCPIVDPTEEDPFRSIGVKWVKLEMPMQPKSLIKPRDFVYVEATGYLNLANGERIGYNVLHSIEFPLTTPQSSMIRGNLSVFSFFRQIETNVIDNFTSCVVDPGGKAMRLLFVPISARAMLTATDFAYCGQMKKLSRLLQQKVSSFKPDKKSLQEKKECVICGKISSKKIRGFGPSVCKLCSGRVCSSCKIRKRVSYISMEDQLVQRKMAFCPPCISMATNSSAQQAARDQATGVKPYDGSSASPHSNESVTEVYD
ncbi:hypothetical protein PHYSODRAFT_264083 [Phytophthora sojae]|uniref:FYVE-type domain-containing protein n=1 Tax=Phytophthora sojae (strain P6497) TaxID=1094619 RepID=G4ZM93_PHYSP|nr:hypothetical protein PHYSODRAFT_264083 [Phytophthora sojae]EGZ14626.1 hypothetical protein PHYSODRAFT_264083 [Phytophthora sojae]|eukprot:XP_009528375.1 hypothetical protein PHYSODRAFT_264083 [Phytophthora sojae]